MQPWLLKETYLLVFLITVPQLDSQLFGDLMIPLFHDEHAVIRLLAKSRLGMG